MNYTYVSSDTASFLKNSSTSCSIDETDAGNGLSATASLITDHAEMVPIRCFLSRI